MKDVFSMKGKTLEAFAGAKFKVRLENGHLCTAVVSGKMQKNLIKVLVGDDVEVEFSPYDLNLGRIVWREHDPSVQIKLK